jgi:hypothetical protein
MHLVKEHKKTNLIYLRPEVAKVEGVDKPI